MSDSRAGAAGELPAKPSKEHLRKQAKRLAADRSLGLAEAQRRLAGTYGSRTWADLMRRVDRLRGGDPDRSPLAEAARAGDLPTVRTLLAEGHPVDDGNGGTPLWYACTSSAPDADRIAIVEELLAAGALSHDLGDGPEGGGPLQAAAARGPLRLVELLISHGAVEWRPDRTDRSPLEAARGGSAEDKAAIVELLDRPVIRDPSFRAAVTAVQLGEVAVLERLLDAEPRLLHERMMEPDCYRQAPRRGYFTDPKLFWFIANNPTLVDRMPVTMPDVARLMIARGVGQSDLDYALELVMTSRPAREAGLQIPLLTMLLDAGCAPTPDAILSALAHGETSPIEALLERGHPVTTPIAAATGRADRLRELLANTANEAGTALGLAVINEQAETTRVALDAGADPNAYVPVHTHMTPLHQAAVHDDLAMLRLLISRGARTDLRDRMWDGTPRDWAIHAEKPRAAAYLENLEPG